MSLVLFGNNLWINASEISSVRINMDKCVTDQTEVVCIIIMTGSRSYSMDYESFIEAKEMADDFVKRCNEITSKNRDNTEGSHWTDPRGGAVPNTNPNVRPPRINICKGH